MDEERITVAQRCLEGAEANAMTFPQIVGVLTDAGFEGYSVDFRRAAATYYLADGDSVELAAHRVDGGVAAAFDQATVQAAIREAQQLVPGYTYRRFCAKVVAAGCAGYMVSFSGRRVVYFGRDGGVHVGRFPD